MSEPASGCRLPIELVQQVVETLQLDEVYDADTFRSLRLVDVRTRLYAEDRAPGLFRDLVSQVATSLVSPEYPYFEEELQVSLCLPRERELKVTLDGGATERLNVLLTRYGDRLSSVILRLNGNTLSPPSVTMRSCSLLTELVLFQIASWGELNAFDLRQTPSLRTLRIVGCDSEEEGVRRSKLAAGFFWPSSLRCLDLISIPVEESAIQSLRALVEHGGLDEVLLDWCKVDAATVEALGIDRGEGIKMLSLRGNDLGTEGIKALHLGQQKSLETLCLSNNRIEDPTALELYRNTSLRKLDLTACRLSQSLDFQLHKNTSLETLSLQQCFRSHIGLEHFDQLGRQLVGNRTLVKLDLGQLKLADDELSALRLCEHVALKEVCLNGNVLTDRGVRAARLERCATLQNVDLRDNEGVTIELATSLLVRGLTVLASPSNRPRTSADVLRSFIANALPLAAFPQ